MATFKVETKNQFNVDKKPRVYFTCHCDDFEKYFKKICDDIFKTHDCAIYYTEDMTEAFTDDNKATDLIRSNLFVVPVTFKLLSVPNRTMDVDIPYALENRIPILPIMMETNIDKLYSTKFGELQYLNPYSTDLTEIPYEKKLKSYLEAILISEELATRVREAFDAYIFLSYRKKDRKHANELMRLIHTNPVLRDIAIWFDEFLTPGESFEKNIEKILNNSKLFALLVTPNLLEEPDGEPNYVMKAEYPIAHDKGIKILPAEMEETDKTKLSKKFKDIPVCINCEKDGDVLKQRMVETLSNFVRKSYDNEPEHNFLIGIAYLNGIDVEVNQERAFRLILSAAEANLPEAIEKIVSMYKNGEAVAPDKRKVLEWQHKLVTYYREQNICSPNPENKMFYLIALFNLGQYLFEYGYYKYANDVFAQVIKLSETAHGESFNDSARLLYLNSQLMQTHVLLALEQEYNAQKVLLEICDICEKALTNDESDDLRLQLSMAYFQLSKIEGSNLRITTEKDYLKKCVETLKKIQKKGTFTYHKILSLYSYHISCLYLKLNQLSNAQKNSMETICLAEQTKEAYTLPTEKLDLICYYTLHAKIQSKCNQYDDAIIYFEKALHLFSKFDYKDIPIKYQASMCELFNTLAEFYYIKNEFKKAKHYFELLKEMSDTFLTHHTDSVLFLHYISGILGLAKVYEREGNIQSTIDAYNESCETLKKNEKNFSKKDIYAIQLLIDVYIKEFSKKNKTVTTLSKTKNVIQLTTSLFYILFTSIGNKTLLLSLKQLCTKNTFHQNIINILTLMINVSGDAFSWAFFDETSSKWIKILRIIKKYVYILRIPFYALLSIFNFYIIHFIVRCQVPLCSPLCEQASLCYTVLSSTIMGVVFLLTKQLKIHKIAKGILDFVLAIASCILSLIIIRKVAVCPDNIHIIFLTLPLGVATAMFLLTKLVKLFLSRITGE